MQEKNSMLQWCCKIKKEMSKGQTKGRYICKVGFYDIYAKDTMRSSKERSGKPQVDKDHHCKAIRQARQLPRWDRSEVQ